VKTLLFSLTPFIVFSGVRVLLGGAPVEVNYGFNILAGEFPTYGLRLFSISGLVSLSIRVFLSFSFLWFGLLNIRRDRFLYINTISALPLIIIPTILLSSRISRVIGVLFPLIIVLFLFFFKKDNSLKASERDEDVG